MLWSFDAGLIVRGPLRSETTLEILLRFKGAAAPFWIRTCEQVHRGTDAPLRGSNAFHREPNTTLFFFSPPRWNLTHSSGH